MKTLSKEDLKYLNAGFTIGKLREFLAKHPELPDDGLVMIERVEDVYYEKHGWKVYLKDDEHTQYLRDKDKSPEEVEKSMNQYHPAWCSKIYPDDKNLFIDLHY